MALFAGLQDTQPCVAKSASYDRIFSCWNHEQRPEGWDRFFKEVGGTDGSYDWDKSALKGAHMLPMILKCCHKRAECPLSRLDMNNLYSIWMLCQRDISFLRRLGAVPQVLAVINDTATNKRKQVMGADCQDECRESRSNGSIDQHNRTAASVPQ